MIFFSVVMPLYNKVKEVDGAIQAVLHQSYENFELIIVDDGSTDGSDVVVSKINDSRIRLIQQQNSGVSAARNRGASEAKFELICFVDADDHWDEDFLDVIKSLVEEYPDAGVYATAYRSIRNGIYNAPLRFNGLKPNFKSGLLPNYFEVAYQSDPLINSSVVVIRRNAFMSIGGFPVGISSGEDLLTWARLAANYKVAYINEPHVTVYVSSATRIPENNDRVGAELSKLVEDFPNLKYLKKYYFFWKKIRVSILLRVGETSRARQEAWVLMRMGGITWRLLILILLSYLPNKIFLLLLNYNH